MRRFVGGAGGIAPAAWLTVTDCPATFRVPLREVPVVLAPMLNVTEPMPEPLAPAVTVIHDVVVVAVQAQDVPDVTLSVRLLASASTSKLVGVRVAEQPVAPCVTVTVCPATVNVPVREAPVVLAPMLNVTEPMPEPLAPAVTVIHDVVVVAVQAQDVPDVTLSVRLLASASTSKLVGVRVAEQPVAPCVTVTVCPATVNVPVREAPVVLAPMLNVTEPMPEPLAPAVTVIHDVVVVAVQAQDVPDVTLSVRLLASASTSKLVGVRVAEQPVAPCVTVTVRPATVNVPVREAPVVLAPMLNVTEPMPEPLAPAVTVIHDVVVVAVHAQDVPEVTLSVRLVASASTAKLVGVRVAEQPVAPCVTVTVCPATVNVPVREAPVVLAATLNVTEPMPEPLAPAVTVIHDVVVVAVHAQDVPEVTLSVRLVASASTAKLVGVTVAEQPVAPCVTVTVCPATVNVPVREAPVVFAPMLNVTEPMPEPLAPAVTVIHDVVVVAVQAQDVPEMTLSVRLVASASTAKLVGVTVPVQPPVP